MFRLSIQENEIKYVLIPLSSTFLDWNCFELHKFRLLILLMYYMYLSAAVETWNDVIHFFLVASALRPTCHAFKWHFYFGGCDL